MRAASLALLAASAALAAACSNPRRGEPLNGPLALEEAAQARGRSVYLQNCYRCHQGGEGGLGPPISGSSKLMTRIRVRHGLGGMPAFPVERISDRELDELLSYLAALRRHKTARGGEAAE
jgi:mono/diheme cytochrome c family protein